MTEAKVDKNGSLQVEYSVRNVYQKIQKVRAELVKLNLKKTGKNKHTGATYYELGDFLPHLNKLMDENGLMTHFGLVEDLAMIHIYDTDKPESQLAFTCPVAEVKIVNGQPIQNLGGQITYLRRYLLMVAFEISESDSVDNTTPELGAARNQLPN